MIRRLFWLGLGVAVGVVVVRQLTRTAQAYTPAGMAASLQESAVGMLESVRTFVEDVREGMAEKEAEIRAAFAAGELLGEHVATADQSFGNAADSTALGVGATPWRAQGLQYGPHGSIWHQEGGNPR